VEELLYKLPISGYFALDISAVSKVNDMLGGVTITIPEDYTMIDPAFVKGDTITLTGEQAEKYVRYRDQSTLGSNDERMQRQVQYIPALLEAFRSKLGDSQGSLEDFLAEISPYMVTNLDIYTMEDMFRQEWKIGETVYVPGKTTMGEQYEEFHVDEKELKKILIEIYYLQK
jgi:anionic cell wall polymer biosynthesis LytR-Cps2A-Psr (LCP) family protein